MGRFRVRPAQEAEKGRGEFSYHFIGLLLGAEEYVLEITKVREIIMLEGITYVPRVKSHFEGVINLRGEVVPVINLRVKLGMEAADFTPRSRIIITETERGPVGLLVDAVTSVLRLPQGDVEQAAGAVGEVSAEFLRGIGRNGARIVGWLDVEKLGA
ncbi:MAG: purine-binding chemotaxis protein CheW [Nitrospinae bacterium]|nr:purine-binding chemotaxis protein CheW [Nitrospinota bacterium]